MSGRHRRAVVAALSALATAFAATPASAPAAQVTLQPQPAEARTFATSSGGWRADTSYGGLICITGVTCPTGIGRYVSAGGTGGAGDGFLRASFATTLTTLLTTTTVSWTSPQFTAPTGTDQATLSAAVRPDVASLLSVLSTMRFDMTIVDVAAPGRSTTVASVPIADPTAGFGTVSAAVPPGALTPGRTYEIRLAASVASTLTAISSGSVDFDDVELRLADLQPPTGLTASFPAGGAPRIEGTVDPQGVTTSVVVEYGPTTAYGSSTSPVTVGGSGSQPFTIPLAGLTPGATYQYRVVAQNADGTLSTANASFVAPTPPADAPPVVTGPGNSRDRTVVFDRAADVASARVEVLGAGGTVLSTDADLDDDGQVTIALPDADGDYAVRVVRENGAGQTSTSASVGVTLDRVAPAVDGVGLAVRPVLSSDTLRTVTYTAPADAIAVRAQVVDATGDPVGAPVAGSAGVATVQLGTAEGDYRVELTLLDAAGNAATVTSGVVTLDESAPSAGGAPTVTGPGNARERDVAFDRDPDTTTATIEVLDAGGAVVGSTTVLTGGEGTITLPDADGAYGVRVRQVDGAGNAATSPIAAATLDRVAPNAGPAPTVTGPLDALTVTFERAPDAVTAVVQVVGPGGDVVATVPVPSGTSATVDLPDAEGAYGIQIVQTDASGNSATSPPTSVARPPAGGDPGGGDPGGGRDGGTGGQGTGGGGDTGNGTGNGSGGTGGGGQGGTGNGGQGGTGDGGGQGGDGSGRGAQPLTDPGRFGSVLQRCFGGDIVLTDVTAGRGARVRVKGLTRYAAGTTVRIVDQRGRTVGRARSNARGVFGAHVRAPRSRRQRLASGYRAVVGRQRSPLVRLRRANVLGGIAAKRGVVTVRGRVDLRRAGTVRRIVALGGRGATACSTARALRTVGRTRVDRRTGAYVLRVRAPRGSGRIVLRTQVVGSKLRSRSSFTVR